MTYSFSSALFDIPNNDFDIIFALRARSEWHFDNDRGEMRRRVVVVTAVAIINFGFALILLVFINTTTNNLTFLSFVIVFLMFVFM